MTDLAPPKQAKAVSETKIDIAGSEELKVQFISGFGPSGSTILDHILGQLNGFFSLGELLGGGEQKRIEEPFVWMRRTVNCELCQGVLLGCSPG